MAEVKKGFISHKRKIIEVVKQPFSPENKFISKAEFKRRRQAVKEANEAAEKAKQEVLKKAGVGTKSETQVNVERDALILKISDCKKNLATAKEAFDAEPDSVKLRKKVEKLGLKLEELETELDGLEGNE